MEDRIWKLEKESMTNRSKFDAILHKKEGELKETTAKLHKMEEEIKSLSKASLSKQDEQQKMLAELTTQLEKIKLTGSMSTPDDR